MTNQEYIQEIQTLINWHYVQITDLQTELTNAVNDSDIPPTKDQELIRKIRDKAEEIINKIRTIFD